MNTEPVTTPYGIVPPPVVIGGGKVLAYNADCRAVLHHLAQTGDRVHAVCEDPPYHLTSIVKRFGREGSAPAVRGTDGAFTRASRGFMGHTWDGGDIAFGPETWRLHLDALLPGGYLTAFASTSGYHHMATAIEIAGFRAHPMLEYLFDANPLLQALVATFSADQFAALCRLLETQDEVSPLSWVFGSGMVKPTRLQLPGTDHLRYGTGAIKPALEPVFMGQKPLEGTGTENWLAHGTGALNVDAARVEREGQWGARGSDSAEAKRVYRDGFNNRRSGSHDLGGYPANVVHDGSSAVAACFPEAPGQRGAVTGVEASAPTKAAYGSGWRRAATTPRHDGGGPASRLFYGAKAAGEDRWYLCRACGGAGPAGTEWAHQHDRTNTDHIVWHPTVKPVALIRWLVRLTCPQAGQTVFDGFAGTGTTGVACLAEGRGAVLVEQNPDYFRILVARCRHYAGESAYALPERRYRRPAEVATHPTLFAGLEPAGGAHGAAE